MIIIKILTWLSALSLRFAGFGCFGGIVSLGPSQDFISTDRWFARFATVTDVPVVTFDLLLRNRNHFFKYKKNSD